ncbi:CapA family protein [Bacillus sp. AGMB 02131]|uniref:CapA family protein n=1 Tax=Peribacillus faecalis TaxID=2772559 RepID=A0A927HBC0_9BACI|nr:CapA family protein [Peribacillus faecalis]
MSIVIVFLWNKESVPVQEKTAAVKEEPSAETTKLKAEPEKVNKVTKTAITISAAGDFTIGSDLGYGYQGSFVEEATKNGLSHFVKGLNNIFIEDDFSMVNLETPLTDATVAADKQFRFKGAPSYAGILEMAGIESVNIANNHTFDYLQKGYDDTIATLENYKIGYFGDPHKYIATVKAIKIGVLGYKGWNDTAELREKVQKDIADLRDQGAQIVIVHYHWGIEREYVPLASQQTLAKYTIDSGADLILGHHPHVVQGIEEYKGKLIVYSLGNFMFGGNRNPSDKDTFVFQQTFYLEDGVLTDEKAIKVVPFSISSVTHRNDYQPTLLTGAEAERVKNKIIEASNKINGLDWLVYEINDTVSN